MHQRISKPYFFFLKPLIKMAEKVDSCASEPEYLSDSIAMLWPEVVVDDGPSSQRQAEPQFTQLTEEEAEIQSYLWTFYNYTEPQTLQDIGFDLNITPELMYLFVPSSSDSAHEVSGKRVQPVPKYEPPPSSQVSQINAVNISSEEPSGKRDTIGNGSDVISRAATHSFNHSSKEPSMTQERMGGSSGNVETSGATKEKKPKSGGSRKKPVKKRGSIDTSRMSGKSEPAAI
ncbi:hypothetical protein PHJA_001207900 [Phtheirospermum japonicum]|uniref:Uncharacterized protein n=1 Tax=Phtheirospermum japonicum TaxID=374723 RepID=A0A830C0B6_9LAMI|nr:hypothetical protein PHJA_001207900 [Phtheirospermum japonicum]